MRPNGLVHSSALVLERRLEPPRRRHTDCSLPSFLETRWIGEFVLSFGEDESGELYVLTSETPGPTGSTGKVYRIVAP